MVNVHLTVGLLLFSNRMSLLFMRNDLLCIFSLDVADQSVSPITFTFD